jgi:hypothetical protein
VAVRLEPKLARDLAPNPTRAGLRFADDPTDLHEVVGHTALVPLVGQQAHVGPDLFIAVCQDTHQKVLRVELKGRRCCHCCIRFVTPSAGDV